MKYYLATTGISEIWDKSGGLLVLGPWCLAERSNLDSLSGIRHVLLPSPWRPATRIKEAADYCRGVYEDLLPRLGGALNAAHSVDYPEKYWSILLGPWLQHFIAVFYDRFRRLEAAAGSYPDFYTYVLSDDNCMPGSYDTYDFLEKAGDDYYNLILFSVIARLLYPENSIATDIARKTQAEMLQRSWKKKLFCGLLNRVLSGKRAVFSEMYHLSYLDMLRLKCSAGFSSLGFAEFIFDGQAHTQSNHSRELRSLIKLGAGCDRFNVLLNSVIPEAIPASYTENYRAYEDMAARSMITPRPAAVGSSIGWFFNEGFKFYAARSAVKGAVLLDFQHGGGYGFLSSMPLEQLSRHKDVFYSWGRGLDYEPNQRALPSAHLSKLKDRYSRATDSILFVSNDFPRYLYRFQSCSMPENMPGYFMAQARFFETLRGDIKKKVLYRRYFDYGWGGMDTVRAACPGIKVITKGRLTEKMKNAGVIVIDHAHTSFIEALVINAPCVFYWDHDVYLMRPEAQGYFEKLRQAGILYKDPESACAKVNEIYDDPVAWWQDKTRQEARREFCERYAYADKDWVNIWAKELRRFL